MSAPGPNGINIKAILITAGGKPNLCASPPPDPKSFLGQRSNKSTRIARRGFLSVHRQPLASEAKANGYWLPRERQARQVVSLVEIPIFTSPR